MGLNQIVGPNHIIFHPSKRWALSAEVKALVTVFEKSATILNLIRSKNTVNITAYNF